MGSQKLGLGQDSSFNSEDNLERARMEDTAQLAVPLAAIEDDDWPFSNSKHESEK